MSSKFGRFLFCAVLGGASVMAAFATLLNVGVARADELQGVSLRQESTQRGSFFYGYRRHQGGGLHGGK